LTDKVQRLEKALELVSSELHKSHAEQQHLCSLVVRGLPETPVGATARTKGGAGPAAASSPSDSSDKQVQGFWGSVQEGASAVLRGLPSPRSMARATSPAAAEPASGALAKPVALGRPQGHGTGGGDPSATRDHTWEVWVDDESGPGGAAAVREKRSAAGAGGAAVGLEEAVEVLQEQAALRLRLQRDAEAAKARLDAEMLEHDATSAELRVRSPYLNPFPRPLSRNPEP
jgi:hypothetical protein